MLFEQSGGIEAVEKLQVGQPDQIATLVDRILASCHQEEETMIYE